MIEASREEASTDSLTGMANRRRLVADLDEALDGRRSAALALFDLNGFKGYNDSFGHPAGDALLARLGTRLGGGGSRRGSAIGSAGTSSDAVAGAPRARRPDRGDLWAALTEERRGLRTRCAHGAVLLPRDARHPGRPPCRLADQRMYQLKARGRALGQPPELRRADAVCLLERSAELGGAPSQGVTAAARERGAAARPRRRHAWAHFWSAPLGLHDVGKVAHPRGRSSPSPARSPTGEMNFVRRHTLIGARILLAAPALAPRGPPGAGEPRALGRRRVSGRPGRRGRSRWVRGSSSPATPSRP